MRIKYCGYTVIRVWTRRPHRHDWNVCCEWYFLRSACHIANRRNEDETNWWNEASSHLGAGWWQILTLLGTFQITRIDRIEASIARPQKAEYLPLEIEKLAGTNEVDAEWPFFDIEKKANQLICWIVVKTLIIQTYRAISWTWRNFRASLRYMTTLKHQKCRSMFI